MPAMPFLQRADKVTVLTIEGGITSGAVRRGGAASAPNGVERTP